MKINSSQAGAVYSASAGVSQSSQVSQITQVYSSKEKAPAEFHIRDVEQKGEQKTKPEAEPDEKELIDAIEKTNKAIEGSTCSFEYSIHEKTKQIMVKVVDKKTKEVIKEFPPEKILDMVAKMWEVAGILVDERR